MKSFAIFVITIIIILSIFLHGFINVENNIFFALRLPTLLLTFFTGATLALSGLRFQNIFENELTSPFTLGLSSTCAFGAALGEIYFLDIYLTPLLTSFLGIALLLIIWKLFKNHEKSKIILAGVAISFLFSGLLMLLQYSADQWNVFKITKWLMGHTQAVGFGPLFPILIGSLILITDSILNSRNMDIYSLGPEIAFSKGLDIHRFQLQTIFITSLSTSLIISYTGPIGFVGLMVPHLTRALIKSFHKELIFFTFLWGGLLLLICQNITRLAFSNQLPEGVITSILGALFFFILLFKKEHSR